MALTLYVETNFPIGIAKGQDPEAAEFLESDSLDVQIAIPGVCVMEAFSVWEFEEKQKKKAHDGFRGGEVLSPEGASVSSPGRQPWVDGSRPKKPEPRRGDSRPNTQVAQGLSFCRPFGAGVKNGPLASPRSPRAHALGY